MKSVLMAALAGMALSTTVPATAADTPSGSQLAKKYGIPHPAVIAHRGDSWHAPEETRAAFLLARDEGADYLEMDLQRTRDGKIIALHDTNLKRTTNIEQVYPKRADDPVNTFTLAELKRLDAGSWFNKAHPDEARASFKGLKIMTLDEVIDIAEGGKNHPGLYIETKQPDLFPGIEHDLHQILARRGLLTPAPPGHGKFDVASTKGRVILETFSRDSLVKLDKEMPDTPKILLLWISGKGSIPAAKMAPRQQGESDASYYGRMQVRSRQDYDNWLDFAREHGAIGVGPATRLADGGVWSYMDMVKPWMNQAAHQRGLLIHPYTVDKAVDFRHFEQEGASDGFFTNNPRSLLEYYHRSPAESVNTILARYGYSH